MKTTLAIVLAAAASAGAQVVYTQPLHTGQGLHKSAWYAPDGLDSDTYTWDSFTLAADADITEIRWIGGYSNFLSGAGRAPVYNFTVGIWPSITVGTEPCVYCPVLREYDIGSNAGETPTGVSIQVGGGMTPLYTYSFVLPTPFHATAGVKYWLQVYAWQGLTPQYGWPPDWGLPGGTGGNGAHFRKINDGTQYQMVPHDLSFTIVGASCYPDCNADGALNLADFGCFQTRFALGDPYADCNGDGVRNLSDFGCYQTKFALGCP